MQIDNLIGQMQIQVNDKIFLKDPNSSDLGKKIIINSLHLIDEIGFEAFTFRKLAQKLETTESSVYRYFENKHKLLIYLSSWYWGWLEYQLVFSTANISSANKRLTAAIEVVAKSPAKNTSFGFFDLDILYRIVISESPKVYLTKEVDDANKAGSYAGYKRLVGQISNIVLEINPSYKYPHMLISTIIEGAHFQHHFADHLPLLTDKIEGEDSISEFYIQLAQKALK